MITLADLDYELPPDRIAQEPIRPRDAARLLVLERATGSLGELRFRELADQIGPEDLLVVNKTRVLPARLCGHKASGGRAEALLLERQPDGTWRALVKARGLGRREALAQLKAISAAEGRKKAKPRKKARKKATR